MCKTEDGKIKLSLKDMVTSGSTGQTSATGVVGVLYELITLVILVALVIFYFVKQDEASNIMAMIDKITIVMGIGAALLGTRKISGAIAHNNEVDVVKAVENAMNERELYYRKLNDQYDVMNRRPVQRNVYMTGNDVEDVKIADEELADESIPAPEQ